MSLFVLPRRARAPRGPYPAQARTDAAAGWGMAGEANRVMLVVYRAFIKGELDGPKPLAEALRTRAANPRSPNLRPDNVAAETPSSPPASRRSIPSRTSRPQRSSPRSSARISEASPQTAEHAVLDDFEPLLTCIQFSTARRQPAICVRSFPGLRMERTAAFTRKCRGTVAPQKPGVRDETDWLFPAFPYVGPSHG